MVLWNIQLAKIHFCICAAHGDGIFGQNQTDLHVVHVVLSNRSPQYFDSNILKPTFMNVSIDVVLWFDSPLHAV